MAIDGSGVADDPNAQPPSVLPSRSPEWAAPRTKEYTGNELWLRYFAHGAIFSLLMLFLGVVWIVITIPLVLCGAFIGLGVALVLLVFMIGYLNTFITEQIWGVQVDSDWKSVLTHGVFLIVVLMIASIPSIIIRAITGDIITAAVLFLAYCFVDGIIGRWVANYYLKSSKDEMRLPW